MTPEALGDLHARAITVPAPWDARAFTELLATPGVFLCTDPNGAGFALGRVVLDEAELLTLAVDPDHQGKGLGRDCLACFEAEAATKGATRAFLEVAASNDRARTLYRANGWTEIGRRKAYYRHADAREDAVLMEKSL